MSCFVSRPVSCPDVPVSARVRKTSADTGTRDMIQGVIQNKTCNNLFITYIQQQFVSNMCSVACCRCVIKINYYMSYSVLHIAKVGRVNRNAAS